MQDNDGLKEVYFSHYCKICEHFNKKESEEPCSICLTEPCNLNSHKPVKWEEAIHKKKVVKEEKEDVSI